MIFSWFNRLHKFLARVVCNIIFHLGLFGGSQALHILKRCSIHFFPITSHQIAIVFSFHQSFSASSAWLAFQSCWHLRSKENVFSFKFQLKIEEEEASNGSLTIEIQSIPKIANASFHQRAIGQNRHNPFTTPFFRTLTKWIAFCIIRYFSHVSHILLAINLNGQPVCGMFSNVEK